MSETSSLRGARVGVYAADQRLDRTLSRGIYSYTAMLVEGLALQAPEAQIVVIGNRANRADMSGWHSGAAVQFVELPDACAGGVARLAADHVIAPVLARRHALDLLHFPKGFLPLARLGVPCSATLHDTIPLYYEQHHPGYFPPAKLRYLASMIRRSLLRGIGVVTDSESSRSELLSALSGWGLPPVEIAVCPLAPHAAFAQAGERAAPLGERPPTLLHLGSRLPHKRTAETIAAFQELNRRTGARWRLRVLGFEDRPPEWAFAGTHDVEFAQAPDLASLVREMAGARALLLLSAVEGFGLPAVEAWAAGTPVCYSQGGALGEVLHGVPGGCTRPDADALARALADIAELRAADVARWRAQLVERHSPARLARRMVELVGSWISRGSSRDPSH